MADEFDGLKTKGYTWTDHVDEVLGPVQFNQGSLATPVFQSAQQSGQGTTAPSSGQPSGNAQSPGQVYDPDDRRDYDADGGVLPKGVKPDIFNQNGSSYWQTRRGQIWKQTGDGQWSTVSEHEARGVRRDRGDVPQSEPDRPQNGLNSYTRDAISDASGVAAGKAARKKFEEECPCSSDLQRRGVEAGIGFAIGNAVGNLLPKEDNERPTQP